MINNLIPTFSFALFILIYCWSHRNVTAVEHQLRPKGLGLGADRSLIKDLEPSKRKQPPKPGDERPQEEELVMGPGSYVLVESGSHKDKYGKVGFIWVRFHS